MSAEIIDGQIAEEEVSSPEVQEEPEVEASSDESEQSQDRPEEPSEPQQRRNKVPPSTRINQATRAKMAALADNERLRQELQESKLREAQLFQQVQNTTQTALTMTESSIDQKLKRAKESYLKAREEGDIQAESDAAEALAEAKAESLQYRSIQADRESSYIKAQQERELYQNYTPPPVTPQVDEGLFYDWVDDNPWFNPQSDDYNDNLTKKVTQHSHQVANWLQQIGRPDLIYKEPYYQELTLFAQKQTELSRRQPQMNQSRNGIAPVNRSNSTASSTTGGVVITPHDKAVAKEWSHRFGVSEESYLKNIALDKQKQRDRGRPY